MRKLSLVLFGCAGVATLTMTAGARAQIDRRACCGFPGDAIGGVLGLEV